jgi:hypothetical protein
MMNLNLFLALAALITAATARNAIEITPPTVVTEPLEFGTAGN